MNFKTDKKIIAKKGGWNFSGNVPKNFVDHANKSIPFYEDCHDLILDYSDFFCKKILYVMKLVRQLANLR